MFFYNDDKTGTYGQKLGGGGVNILHKNQSWANIQKGTIQTILHNFPIHRPDSGWRWCEDVWPSAGNTATI